MTYLKRSVLIAICVIIAACASSASNAAAAKDQQTTIVVDNQALLDMTIYALRGGQKIRIGTATGLSKTRLTLPVSLVAGATTIRFLADPIGSNRTPVSEEVNIIPGDEIGLMIPPQM